MKRVLFDENLPGSLRHRLPEFEIRTVQEEGWGAFKNGELLRRASGKFDVLLTADQRLRYQQNIQQFAIGVVAIETFDTTLAGLRQLLPQINQAVASVVPGTILVVRTA